VSTPSRLSLAIESGTVILPEAGRIAVFALRAAADITALPAERVQVITTMKPDFDAYAARGYDCAVAPEGRYAAALVCLPRAKPLARAMIAQAADVTDGPVIIDGDKSDGVESILKDCRRRVETGAPLSKAHGKIFTLPADAEFADWRGTESEIAGGYVTAPGVFSADGIDPGSDWLARALPDKLGAHVIDLGAGWGYLAAQVLGRESITRLDLVEADHAALMCAQRNVLDPRAAFHWADATHWQPDSRADSVIMNPPFHTGRSADPDLGRAFIAAAARALKPSGMLWLVANRHLPYEATLAQRFKHVEEIAGDTRFKILQARHPSRQTL
jgi:16S rRNA (guanine1207-N2)-methyltransferase